MPRTARIRSGSGTYHVVARGVNRQDIFLDDEDSLRYLNNLRRLKTETACTILAYCLMSNHVHLVLRESVEGTDRSGVAKLMHRLGTVTAQWYNQKYQRVGHVFQERYASTAIEDDTYLLAALRYVHQNPVQAQLTTRCGDYPFSSYTAYARGEDPFLIAEISLAIDIMGNVERLLRFFNQPGSDRLSSTQTSRRPTDEEVRSALDSLLRTKNGRGLQSMSKAERDEILIRLKSMGGFSVRQMARATGLSPATIVRA